MDNIVPFPQADDFEKIVFLLNLTDEEVLNDLNKLKNILGDIAERQVAYYLSAAMFLELIEIRDGRKKYSDKAIFMRQLNSVIQEAELIALILSNSVFAHAFTYTKIFGKQEVCSIADMIKMDYPYYSDAIYRRRAQTVIKWIQWVDKHLRLI